MVEKKKLKKYASLLLFDMSDKEYDILQEEFEIVIKQLERINEIEGLNSFEQMTFPNLDNKNNLREDKIKKSLKTKEGLKNSEDILYKQVKIPKVVE